MGPTYIYAFSIVDSIFNCLNHYAPKQYSENFRNFEQVELVENLHPNYPPYGFLHNLQPFLLGGKWNISIIFSNVR